MEEKDISSIANAVTSALSKLNADTEKAPPEKVNEMVLPEVFKCPDCGAEVAAGIAFCQSCGCRLDWEE